MRFDGLGAHERLGCDHNYGHHGEETPFALVYADEVKQHLRAIETKYHSLIQSAVEAQLLSTSPTWKPETESL